MECKKQFEAFYTKEDMTAMQKWLFRKKFRLKSDVL